MVAKGVSDSLQDGVVLSGNSLDMSRVWEQQNYEVVNKEVKEISWCTFVLNLQQRGSLILSASNSTFIFATQKFQEFCAMQYFSAILCQFFLR